MDLVSYLEWLYRQDLVKIHHGQLPVLGLKIINFGSRETRSFHPLLVSRRQRCRRSKAKVRIAGG